MDKMGHIRRAASQRRYLKEDRKTHQTRAEEAAPDASAPVPGKVEDITVAPSGAGTSKELDRKPERKGFSGTA